MCIADKQQSNCRALIMCVSPSSISTEWCGLFMKHVISSSFPAMCFCITSGKFFLLSQEQEQLSYSSTRTKNPSVVVTGLRPSTVYVFHVRARTTAGYTAYSPNFEFATAAEGTTVMDSWKRCLCTWLKITWCHLCRKFISDPGGLLK